MVIPHNFSQFANRVISVHLVKRPRSKHATNSIRLNTATVSKPANPFKNFYSPLGYCQLLVTHTYAYFLPLDSRACRLRGTPVWLSVTKKL
jgi:hypothetical protein